jgi:hypothetical protein
MPPDVTYTMTSVIGSVVGQPPDVTTAAREVERASRSAHSLLANKRGRGLLKLVELSSGVGQE